MYASDFSLVNTTHDLLLMVLYSELGLMSVTHPSVTIEGIVAAFEPLRTKLTSDLSVSVKSDILDIMVSRRDDLLLFYDLYTNLNFMSAIQLNDEVKLLDLCVYPVVGNMLTMSKDVQRVVETHARQHAEHYGEIVTYRMNKTLKAFNINSHINLGKAYA